MFNWGNRLVRDERSYNLMNNLQLFAIMFGKQVCKIHHTSSWDDGNNISIVNDWKVSQYLKSLSGSRDLGWGGSQV